MACHPMRHSVTPRPGPSVAADTLRAMIGWIAVALVLAAGVARLVAGYPRTEGTFGALSRREVATVAATAEALFPAGGAIEVSGVDAGIPRYVDRMLLASHPRQRTLMHLLFFLLEQGTVFKPAPGGLRGFRRFSKLALDQRMALLEGWEHSGLFVYRLAFTSLRAIFTFGYFSHPPVLRALRLAPYAIDTPVCEADLLYPPIGGRRSDVGFTRADLTPPSDGVPLDLDGPLLAGYAEGDA